MKTSGTHASLLLRARNLRDRDGWDEFVEIYGPLILRYLRRIGVGRDDALDLVQDVLHIVVRNIGRFEYDSGRSFRAWLRKVATNRAYRFFKERRRRPAAVGGTIHQCALHQACELDDEHEALIEQEWRRRMLELAMKRVRSEVRPQSWRVFELCDIQSVPCSEAAERLGMAIGAVYTSLSRTRARLRKAVEELND